MDACFFAQSLKEMFYHLLFQRVFKYVVFDFYKSFCLFFRPTEGLRGRYFPQRFYFLYFVSRDAAIEARPSAMVRAMEVTPPWPPEFPAPPWLPCLQALPWPPKLSSLLWPPELPAPPWPPELPARPWLPSLPVFPIALFSLVH